MLKFQGMQASCPAAARNRRVIPAPCVGRALQVHQGGFSLASEDLASSPVSRGQVRLHDSWQVLKDICTVRDKMGSLGAAMDAATKPFMVGRLITCAAGLSPVEGAAALAARCLASPSNRGRGRRLRAQARRRRRQRLGLRCSGWGLPQCCQHVDMLMGRVCRQPQSSGILPISDRVGGCEARRMVPCFL